MTQKQAIQLFEDRKVRTVWDERTETWYFSVLDVISALTDTVNPTDYFKKMRKRDEALASFVGTNCPQIAMRSETQDAGRRCENRPADYPVDSVTESRAFQAMDGAGGKRPPRPNARP